MGVCDLISKELNNHLFERQLALQAQVLCVVCIFMLPKHRQGSKRNNDQELHQKHAVKHFVNHQHQISHFLRRFLGVHHNLCVISNVDSYSDCILRIFERHATQE